MITLYGFGRAFGNADPSAFVGKTEVLLKMSGLPFTLKRGNLRKSPKGKLPYIDDNGMVVSDSNFIRAYLEEKYGIDFNGGYSPAERAAGLAFERMCEDHLYWAIVEVRWLVEENFKAGPAQFFKTLPALVRPFIVRMILRNVKKNLHVQGFGRHDRADIERLAIADIDAIADFLGDKPYLLGARPSGADATVFSFLHSAQSPVFTGPYPAAVNRHPNLVAYIDRMLATYYPDGLART
ncbi:MAG: glutathione S-transferase family protein [Proteobacteria bacterium]|nr:glutathione S-transferase family protein [Pseudomonadota bacterium]